MRVAVAGNPNSGKTTLFNRVTGARARVGNYPGVTVERREANTTLPSGRTAVSWSPCTTITGMCLIFSRPVGWPAAGAMGARPPRRTSAS